MSISAFGAINPTALIVPGLYVQIVPPQLLLLNGVPTNVIGLVGSASWGPVNSPTEFGTMSQYASLFGPVINRTLDLGTSAALATLQGAQDFVAVRVTDGTDVAATFVVTVTSQTLRTYTSLYTGSFGNQITVTESIGSAASTTRVTVAIPGRVPEVFDNIPGTLAALSTNIANAINNGQSSIRGPSKIVKCVAGAGTSAQTLPITYTLATGTDGATSITTANMVGTDTFPRTGMYALRSQGCSIGVLCDNVDGTSWSTQNAFGLSEGIYMMLVGAASQTISAAVTAKVTTAALDSYASKVILGDWIFWQDQVNGVTRLVSPQGVFAGLLSNTTPNNSSLNKQVFGIVGTQGSQSGQNYSNADLQTLVQAGIDVIGNAAAISTGNYFAPLVGHNASSNPTINGDNYTRMTNFIATTINAGMGPFVGQLNNPTVQGDALATLNAFFTGLFDNGLIGTADGNTVPFSLQINNSLASLGVMQINVSVVYLSVVEKLLVNIQGGQTVQINRLTTAPNI